MTKNFPHVAKDINPQMQEAQKTPKRKIQRNPCQSTS